MTITDLVQAVLEDLRIIAADETASAADAVFVKARYERVRARYAQRLLVDWTATDDIPAGAEDALVRLVQYECAKSFGRLRDPEDRIEGLRMLAEYGEAYWPRQGTQIEAF